MHLRYLSGISKYFTYPEFLYNIQSEILTNYHETTADVLYRGNDVWKLASYSRLITKTAGAEIEPQYTMTKTVGNSEAKLGLVIAYNVLGRESLNSYLVGTVDENGKNVLSLYKFSSDSTILRSNAT